MMKKHEEARVAAETVQLGSVSGDTQGDGAVFWEATGLRPFTGISDE
jgi:hypothetical protein